MPDQILVTGGGSMAALDLTLRILLGRGDRVAVEAPSYANTLAVLARAGARLIPVPFADGTGGDGGNSAAPEGTASGWDMGEWRRVLHDAGPRLLYVIPDFHNPTGLLIGEDQRRELVAQARAAGAVVIADESMA